MKKHLFIFSILVNFSLLASSISSWTFSDVDHGWNSDALAKLYFHNSELQRQWAWESLGKISFSGDEKVLDFGCGDGKITAEMARLARNGSVLGIDVSEKMLELANVHFPSSTFSNLAFKNTTSITLADFPGKQDCDLVCAFTVFHLISSPIEVLKNLRAHLKPSGKFIFVMPTGKSPAFHQAATEVFMQYGLPCPWSNKAPSDQPTMRTIEGCTQILEEAGYHVNSLEEIDTDYAFYDLEDFITWLVGTATATWRIPFSMSPAFFTSVAERLCEIDPTVIDEKGRIRYKAPRIHGVATPSHNHDL